MKKALLYILAILTVLSSFGCGTAPTPTKPILETVPVTAPEPTQPEQTVPQPTETEAAPTSAPVTEEDPSQPTLPDTCSLFGLNLGGMSANAARAAFQNTIDCYHLSLTVNGKTVSFSADELHITLSEPAFEAWFDAALEGDPSHATGLLIFSVNAVTSKVKNQFGQTLKNATVAYSSQAKRFLIQKEQSGIHVNTAPAEDAAKAAIRQLSPTAAATVTTGKANPTITKDDPRLAAAAESANSYLNLSLSYIFEAPGVNKATVTLSKDTLATFIKINDDLTVSLNTNAVDQFVSTLASRHGGKKKTDSFVSTYGKVISNRQVEYYGAVVDKKALYEDLMTCLKNKTSGSRTAVYLSAEATKLPYGGNYVEVSIADQHLWVYKNGKIVVSTPVVSGNVSNGCWTGGGVFSIYDKDTDCWLVGRDYRDHVDYWMGFNGNIGLHDASWRSEFGESIYLYKGSHGCVNLPSDIAGQVYANVSVGTKVIVHSVVGSVGNMTQVLSGTASYKLTTQSSPFTLDVTAKYISTTITYTSSNSKVVTVDKWGTVRVVGPGTATITVHSAKVGKLSGADFKVSITVEKPVEPKPEPQPTEPKPTEPKPTEPKPTEPKPTEPKPTEPKPTEPKPTEPKPTEPKPTEPKPTEPEVTEPEITEPETTEPETTEPEITEPETTEPETTEPEATEPEITEPEVTEPEVTEPEVTEPEVTEPEVTEPTKPPKPGGAIELPIIPG